MSSRNIENEGGPQSSSAITPPAPPDTAAELDGGDGHGVGNGRPASSTRPVASGNGSAKGRRLLSADEHVAPETRERFAMIDKLIEERGSELRRPGVIDIRSGYRFRGGWITGEPAIIVTVREKRRPESLADGEDVPRDLAGIPVDVEPAPPIDQLSVPEAGESSLHPFFEAARLDWGASAAVHLASEEAAAPPVEALSDIRYEPPPGVELREVTEAMAVTCHVSPDAGWKVLRGFIDGVTERMTIAMYDFTAPHVLRRLRTAMDNATGELLLILDPKVSLPSEGDTDSNKADDLPESTVVARLRNTLGQRFDNAWAVLGNPGGIFANSYHIKVAVRDGRSFWLSSGNLQSSNQPDLDPLGADANNLSILREYNREWNVVVEHPGLAEMFEKFIKHDFKQARAFSETVPTDEVLSPEPKMPDLFVPAPTTEESLEESAPRFFAPRRFPFTPQNPLRVQPLLTPDNYADFVLPIIKSAREKLYFQNQSIGFARFNYEMFDALVNALRDKIDEGVDVRIILRGDFAPRRMLDDLKRRGFKESHIKFQRNCHTKGIISDSKITLVSSHNWTNSGTLFNRDAGLIFHDRRIARYYEEVFLHDWDNLARHLVAEEVAPPLVAADSASPPPPGMIRVPWNVYYED